MAQAGPSRIPILSSKPAISPHKPQVDLSSRTSINSAVIINDAAPTEDSVVKESSELLHGDEEDPVVILNEKKKAMRLFDEPEKWTRNRPKTPVGVGNDEESTIMPVIQCWSEFQFPNVYR